VPGPLPAAPSGPGVPACPQPAPAQPGPATPPWFTEYLPTENCESGTITARLSKSGPTGNWWMVLLGALSAQVGGYISEPRRLLRVLTRKMDGKTVTRMLSDEEVADYGPLFENSRRLRVLTAELQELSLGLVEPSPARPRSNPKQRRSVKTTRTGRTGTTRSQA